jgi:O-antigen/teichoic acid export membrane protein
MDKQQTHTETIHKILSGARWAVVLRLIGQAISWVSTIIVVRFISPEDYGLNAMLEAPAELLLLLSTLGLDLALVRARTVTERELRSIFGWLLVINSILFLTYFFGATLIAAYFNEPRLELLGRVLSFVFLLTPFRVVPNALLDRELKFKLRAFAELIANVSASIATLALAIWGAGVWALVLGVMINRILLTALLLILHPWIIVPSLNFSAVRGMMTLGGVMFLWISLVLIADKLAILIAGPILGAELLGIFEVTFQFALLPLIKVMPIINPIMFPAFSKFQDRRDLATHYLEKSLGLVALGLFPVMLGTASIAHEFVATVLGEKWLAVATPLALLSVAMPFRMTTSFLRPVLNSMGRPDLALRSVIVALLALLPLVTIGAHQGVIGLVAAIATTELIVAFATILLSKAALDITLAKIGKSLRPAIVSSFVMALCVLAVKFAFGHPSGPGWLLGEIAIGVAVYYLMLRVFYEKLLGDAIGLFLGRRKS